MVGNILFNNVFSNPPYQSDAASTSTQTSTKNIFHEFHYLGTKVGETSSMIFPGGRWLQRVKRCQGMSERIYETADMIDWFYNDRIETEKIFPSAIIVDGISIVTWFREDKKRETTLASRFSTEKKPKVITGVFGGSDKIGTFPSVVAKNSRRNCDFLMNGEYFDRPTGMGFLPLTRWGVHMAQQITESGKIVGYGQQHHGIHDGSVNGRKETSYLFGVETNFVEKNADKVSEAPEDFNPLVTSPPRGTVFALLGDERPGSSKRVRGYFVSDSVFKWNEKQRNVFNGWKVAGVQGDIGKRPAFVAKYDIIPPKTIVGPTKVVLGTFNTETEAFNYRKYLLEPLTRRLLFESTGGKLASWGSYVPDFQDYSDNNKLFANDNSLPENHEYIGLSLQERIMVFLNIESNIVFSD